MSAQPNSQRKSGFTLIEVMVSTAIMIVIILAVVTIASDTFKAYDKAVADLTSQSEARGVLDALENDFQTAVIRPDGRCWMEIIIPGASKAPTGAGPGNSFGDIDKSDQPIILLFSSPSDRPRYSVDATPVALKGDTCAVAYRFGQASPFASPGALISQVYGVYRTIIDSENTFKEAIPEILLGSSTVDKSPWDYWYGKKGKQTYNDYSKSPQKQVTNGTLFDFNLKASNPCWTLDSSNLIGANVVSMNLIFWCSSTLPDSTKLSPAPIVDPLARTSQTLRPLIPVGIDPSRNTAAVFGEVFSPTVLQSVTTAKIPSEQFTSRLRIFSDRIYPDDKSNKATMAIASPTQATLLKTYLPYSLKAVEVSITVLTPEGSKELRAYQDMFSKGQSTTGVSLNNTADFKRIVGQYGKNFTRYIRLLGNGG